MLAKAVEDIRTVVSSYSDIKLYNSMSKAPRPSYPFSTFSLIAPYVLDPMTGIESKVLIENEDGFEDISNRLTLEPRMTMSINSYSNDNVEAFSYAKKLHNLFKHSIKEELRMHNIVVVELSNVSNRSVLEINRYEYRYGFDVMFRFTDVIERIDKTIETYEIKGGIKHG